MRPRLRDVALMAGVSTSTASLVLAGKGARRVSAKTAARVRDAALRLGYLPPDRRDDGIGIGLLFDLDGVAVDGREVVEGIERAQLVAWQSGHGPVATAHLGLSDDVDEVVRGLQGIGASAFLYIGREFTSGRSVGAPAPTVYVNCAHPEGAVAPLTVGVDEYGAARLAGLAAAERGYERVLVVSASAPDEAVAIWCQGALVRWSPSGAYGVPEVCRVQSAAGREQLSRALSTVVTDGGRLAILCVDSSALNEVALAAIQRRARPPALLVVARRAPGTGVLAASLPAPTIAVGASLGDLLETSVRVLVEEAARAPGAGPRLLAPAVRHVTVPSTRSVLVATRRQRLERDRSVTAPSCVDPN